MTGPQLPPRTTARRVCRAVVHAGAVATEYLRAGSGPTVLYLRNESSPDAEGDATFADLASRYRVFAPQSPPSGGGFAEWMGGFLDGLGILRATFVVHESMGRDAHEFAAAFPAQVERVVVLSQDETVELAADQRG